MQKHYFGITLILIVSVFLLGACGSAASKETPTPTATPWSVEAISTAAAQTVIFQLTQQAPSITPTPTFTNTPEVTAKATIAQPTRTKAIPTAVRCVNMKFVSDVTIPDGTQMPVNQEFTKTWRVQNTGTCPWTTSFKLIFSSGEAMSGETLPLANAVAAGETVNLSVKLKVPNKSGKLTGIWVMVDDKSQPFGPTLTVVINVGAVSPTPTGSATVTPAQTLIPSTVSTSTSTSTLAPTGTPTPSETPTQTNTAIVTPAP